jgi:hypothetical protein
LGAGSESPHVARLSPVKLEHESYHAHHAPLGAYATFTTGLVSGRGGFGHALRGPARQNVYVGFRADSRATWQLLPLFESAEPGPPRAGEATTSESAFTGEEVAVESPKDVTVLAARDYLRTLGWASDTWRAGRFGFSLLSPFGKTDDPARLAKPAARRAFSPHVNGWIEYDNRDGTAPAQVIFGVSDPDGIFRPLDGERGAPVGFALGTQFAYATLPGRGIEMRQAFDLFAPKFRDWRGLHTVVGESALVFTVPAGHKRRFPLVLAFFQDGRATTGIDTRYAYTRWFRDIEDVLAHGLAHRRHYEAMAERRDRELARAELSDDQRFLIAQATHSYLGNTQLLWGAKGPVWVVGEGEYRMMNTFDLTVDHLFFELRWFPWAVRNVLDLFVARYSYEDRIQLGGGASASGGLSFVHDMGVSGAFAPAGHSSYECEHLRGCFSHMTMEQLLNWVLCAASYAIYTGDRAWARMRRRIFIACAESVRRRDDPDPARRDGVLKHDSLRCGQDGSEITTYDSLDASLGQARNNLYLSVKTLAAWILLEKTFASIGMTVDALQAAASADTLARTLAGKFDLVSGTFPAAFDAGNGSCIIAAVEGLAYPLFLGIETATDRQGRFAPLLDMLARHLSEVLRPGRCIDAVSGAWKMSSTSTNTWFSKIAIAQHVTRSLFPEAMSPAAKAADRVHARWQRSPGCGAYAMCDQIRSDTGITCGSRYYPRGVTSILWLRE